jgi:hypothetical protein
MHKFFLAGAAVGLLALATPASAMPIAKMASGLANAEPGVTQVHYRRYYRSRAYYYRPRVRYVYRNYDYDDYPVTRSYSPYYGGQPYYGSSYGYYGGGPSIGFSFGSGRW